MNISASGYPSTISTERTRSFAYEENLQEYQSKRVMTINNDYYLMIIKSCILELIRRIRVPSIIGNSLTTCATGFFALLSKFFETATQKTFFPPSTSCQI